MSKNEINSIDFMKYRKIAALVSGLILIASIASLVVQGIKLGLDFTGGTLIEVLYDDAIELQSVRSTLEDAGYEDARACALENGLNLPGILTRP